MLYICLAHILLMYSVDAKWDALSLPNCMLCHHKDSRESYVYTDHVASHWCHGEVPSFLWRKVKKTVSGNDLQLWLGLPNAGQFILYIQHIYTIYIYTLSYCMNNNTVCSEWLCALVASLIAWVNTLIVIAPQNYLVFLLLKLAIYYTTRSATNPNCHQCLHTADMLPPHCMLVHWLLNCQHIDMQWKLQTIS